MCLNINWGNLQTLTVAGSSELRAFFLCLEVEGCRCVAELVSTFHVTWGTSVDCSVVIIMAEYVVCLSYSFCFFHLCLAMSVSDDYCS